MGALQSDQQEAGELSSDKCLVLDAFRIEPEGLRWLGCGVRLLGSEGVQLMEGKAERSGTWGGQALPCPAGQFRGADEAAGV